MNLALVLLTIISPMLIPSSGLLTQQGVARGPISVPRDPELERQSTHSLEVARYYFYKRKPAKGDKEGLVRSNKAIEGRLQEIIDLNPNFAKLDEVYFLLGEVYLRWDNFEESVKHFNRVLKEFPDSQFTAESRKRLSEMETQGKIKKGA